MPRLTATNPSGTATTAAADDLNIVAPTYSVSTGKDISPASRTEVQGRTGYVVTLTAQPGGTVRTRELAMTDDRPTFWNVFSLASLPAVTLPVPLSQARLDALTGVTYDLRAGVLVALCGGSVDLSACWTEGAWVDVPTRTWTPRLPGTVAAADVRGLRVSVRRIGELPWERPANPTVTFKFNADRRVTLLYGTDGATDTPVPTTRPDFPPAPGETEKGTFTDQVDTAATGAWRNQADVWTAVATAQDNTVLRHLANKISVTKAPGNGTGPPPEYAPDTPIPYVMTFTNTGSWPMTGLTLVDRIATNA